MKTRALLAFAMLCALPICAHGQSTVTMTPSLTSGDGTLTIPTMTWATSPALSTGTPCVASATPATAQWTGAKAGSGTATNLGPFTADQRLTLACTFPGDSIVTFTWTNPTTNSNGTPLTDLASVELRHTFSTALTPDGILASTCGGPAGPNQVICTSVPQTPTPLTTRTVTGITQTGTLRGVGVAVNAGGNRSGASNVATKVFQGNVVVTQQVDLIVRSVPNGITGLAAQ